MLVINLVLLFFLFSVGGGSLMLFDYDYVLAQSTDFQLPSLSFSNPYSDMPTNMEGSLSELDDIDEEVDSQVTEIIKPTFQNPLKQPVPKEDDTISPATGSTDSGTATRDDAALGGDVYVVDYNNIRVQKFDNQGDFILKWGTKGKSDGQFGVPMVLM